MSQNYLKTFSVDQSKVFGKFEESILEMSNNVFSTMHSKFLREIWGNNVVSAKLRRNQCLTSWSDGRYETYIPTRDNQDSNLSFYRVAIKVLSEVSESKKREEATQLACRKLKPNGTVDSELLVLVAPKQDKRGLVRAFKHVNKQGYLTAIVVNKNPEICMKRILCLVGEFIWKRLKGLMDSLKIPYSLWGNQVNTLETFSIIRIIESYSYSIKQSVFSFLKLYRHLFDFTLKVKHDIGLQNRAKMALEPLKNLKQTDLTRVFSMIRNELKISINVTNNKLQPSESKILQLALCSGGLET